MEHHPDLFTAAEALIYLHLPEDSGRTLETLRASHALNGVKLGRELMYHRNDLDACISRLFGKSTAFRPDRPIRPRLKVINEL